MGLESMCLCTGTCSSPQTSGCHSMPYTAESWAPAPPSEDGSMKSHLQYFSFLHPLAKAYTVWVNEHIHSPDRTGATTSKPKFNPTGADQVSPSHTHQHVMLWPGLQAQATRQQRPSLGQVFPRHLKWHWEPWRRDTCDPYPTRSVPPEEKLLLGLEAAWLAKFFHLLTYELSILPWLEQGSTDYVTSFSDLVLLQ